MKMRRSLWRKLLALAFAILTAVSAYITVKQYKSNHASTNSGIVLNGMPTITTVETEEDPLPYYCTVTIPITNTAASSRRPISLAVAVTNGSVVETIDISISSSIGAGKSVEVTDSFPSVYNYKSIRSISVTFSGKKDEVIFGSSLNKALPQYVKALTAITVILFGVFVYSCVALYLSPKKKVHGHHHHHHHHHHHSSEHSGQSGSDAT